MAIPILPPFGGRSDSEALYDQPQLTTKSARNVRGRDCVTGRIRISTRAGSRKFSETQAFTGKVKALCSTAIDDRKISYGYTPGQEDELWAALTPSKTDSLTGVTDRQSNIYVIDGNAGIAKFNSAGRLLMKVALPVADPAHVVRALFVDEADRIFAGVSAGGDVQTAKVFCILQRPQPGQVAADDPNQYFVLWEITPGAYTEELKVYRGSQLYCAHNYPQENRARVLVYEGIGLEPVEATRIEHSLAYPIHGMEVLDGNVYTASGDLAGDALSAGAASAAIAQTYRLGHPSARGFHPRVVGWTPRQLENANKRIWSWYHADDLDTTDLDQSGREVVSMDEGQSILRWRDRSGHGRHWYANTATGESGPVFTRVGPGGRAALRFLNDSAATAHSMVTLGNASVSKTQADQQRTSVPSYEGAMWCMFLLIRPTLDDVAGTDPRCVWHAANDAAGVSDHGLWVNRACGAAEPGALYSLGAVSYFATTDAADDGGCAAADQAQSYLYSGGVGRHTDTILVTLLWDGAVDGAGGTTKTRCTLRINGAPVDRFTGLAFRGLDPQFLGMQTTAAAIANRFRGEIVEMLVLDRINRFDDTTEPKVLTHDLIDFVEDFPSPATHAQTDNEMTRIESYMMHGVGLGHALGGNTALGGPQHIWTHPYGQLENLGLLFPAQHGPSSPPDYDGAGRSTALSEIIRRYPLIAKHDEQGKLLWVCNETTHPDTGANRGGIGWGVRARKIESDSKVHVWTVGPDAVEATTGEVAVRKVIDLGISFSGASADGAWRHKFTSSRTHDYEHPRMAADTFGNLYLPYFETGAAAEWSLLVFKKDPDGGGLAQILVDFLLSASQQAHAVALPPDALNPDYRTDLATKMAEYVYIITRNESDATKPTVHKLLLVTTTATASGSTRTVVTVAVGDDDIKTVDGVTVATPTGGSGVIDAAAQYVEAFQADREIVVIDGVSYHIYTPLDGTVTVLEATSSGEIPPRAKIGCMWNHRLVLGRFADKPGRYVGSAVGNIRDWDFRRQPRLSTMAFDASLTRAGEVEDVIVAMIPWADDLLFVLGESRILRLTGDPQAGGQIDKVSDGIGGTFGRSHCRDDKERVFVWCNPPGLYEFRRDGIVPLTERTIETSEFSEIDYSTHRIELAWDPIQKGVHIMRVAHGAATPDTHWFWEEKTHALVNVGAVWTDSYSDLGKTPTCSAYLAGDVIRGLLLGCEDGYVRIVDPAAEDDDGSAIDSYVVMGPLNPVDALIEWRLLSTQIVLARNQQGCRLELMASEEAEEIGPILQATDLTPGMNDIFRKRVKGNYLWARLRSALAGRRWSFERGEVEIEAAEPSMNKTT